MSNQDDYASAYYGGKTTFLEWKVEHDQEMQREEAEDALRQFLVIFQKMFPQEYKEILRTNPDARAAAKMFGKEM